MSIVIYEHVAEKLLRDKHKLYLITSIFVG
jgi:hypothetical protein